MRSANDGARIFCRGGGSGSSARRKSRRWILAGTLLFAATTMGIGKGLAKVPLQKFQARGAAVCTSRNSVGCTVFSGSGTATIFGNATVSGNLAILTSAGTGNAGGGFCYPVSGSAFIANRIIGALFNFVGVLCDQGAAGAHSPQTFNGTYVVTGGGIGTGNVAWSDDGSGNILFNARGDGGQ